MLRSDCLDRAWPFPARPPSSPSPCSPPYTHTTTSPAVFMLSWFATRVFMFPVFVIYSTLFESVVSCT